MHRTVTSQLRITTWRFLFSSCHSLRDKYNTASVSNFIFTNYENLTVSKQPYISSGQYQTGIVSREIVGHLELLRVSVREPSRRLVRLK